MFAVIFDNAHTQNDGVASRRRVKRQFNKSTRVGRGLPRRLRRRRIEAASEAETTTTTAGALPPSASLVRCCPTILPNRILGTAHEGAADLIRGCCRPHPRTGKSAGVISWLVCSGAVPAPRGHPHRQCHRNRAVHSAPSYALNATSRGLQGEGSG